MKTERTAILTLLIPLLIVTALLDAVDQDGLALQSHMVMTSLDDVSLHCDRHHHSQAIPICLQPGETEPSAFVSLQDRRRFSPLFLPALPFLLRAPPLC